MNLFDIFSLLILSIISAFVGFSFNRMQDPDMIFEWYKDWLTKLPYKENPKFWHDVHATRYDKNMFLYYLSKPLGLCIICNTTWIGILICLIVTEHYSLMTIFNCITVGVTSAGIVTLIINKYNQLNKMI